jgi:hypothetical protein
MNQPQASRLTIAQIWPVFSSTSSNFAQRRQLVELLVDRVLVTDGEVEIRYVIPLSPDGERTRFCHLRKDYFDDVIHVRRGTATTMPPELTTLLQLGDRAGICWMAVHIDHARRASAAR